MSKGKGKHTTKRGGTRKSERICLLEEKKRTERENRKRLRQQQQQQSSTFKQSLRKRKTTRVHKTRRLADLGVTLNARKSGNQEFTKINNGVGSKESIINVEKRHTYKRKDESKDSPIYDFQEPLKLVNDGLGYRESLMRFVKDLGPIAQKVANRKLGILPNYDHQLSKQVQFQAQMPPPSIRVPPLPNFNKYIHHKPPSLAASDDSHRSLVSSHISSSSLLHPFTKNENKESRPSNKYAFDFFPSYSSNANAHARLNIPPASVQSSFNQLNAVIRDKSLFHPSTFGPSPSYSSNGNGYNQSHTLVPAIQSSLHAFNRSLINNKSDLGHDMLAPRSHSFHSSGLNRSGNPPNGAISFASNFLGGGFDDQSVIYGTSTNGSTYPSRVSNEDTRNSILVSSSFSVPPLPYTLVGDEFSQRKSISSTRGAFWVNATCSM